MTDGISRVVSLVELPASSPYLYLILASHDDFRVGTPYSNSTYLIDS